MMVRYIFFRSSAISGLLLFIEVQRFRGSGVQGSALRVKGSGLRLEMEPSVVGGLRLEVRGKKFCDDHFYLQPIAKRSSNLKQLKALPPT
jgi:hypothetical protein